MPAAVSAIVIKVTYFDIERYKQIQQWLYTPSRPAGGWVARSTGRPVYRSPDRYVGEAKYNTLKEKIVGDIGRAVARSVIF
jgi:hypothetical protein